MDPNLVRLGSWHTLQLKVRISIGFSLLSSVFNERNLTNVPCINFRRCAFCSMCVFHQMINSFIITIMFCLNSNCLNSMTVCNCLRKICYNLKIGELASIIHLFIHLWMYGTLFSLLISAPHPLNWRMFGQTALGTGTPFGGARTQTAPANSKAIEVVSPPEDSISSLAFSPAALQQNFLIAGSWDNNVRDTAHRDQ